MPSLNYTLPLSFLYIRDRVIHSSPYWDSTRIHISKYYYWPRIHHDVRIHSLCVPVDLHQLFKELHGLVTTDAEYSELRDLVKVFTVKL